MIHAPSMVKNAPAPLHILIVVMFEPELGYTFIKNHIAGLEAAGHLVSTLCMMGKNGEVLIRLKDESRDKNGGYANGLFVRFDKVCALKVLLRSIPFLKYGRMLAPTSLLFRLLKVLRGTIHADIIHSHFGPAGALTSILASLSVLSGVQIITLHGYDINTGKHRHLLYKDMFRKGSAFIVNSRFSGDRLESLGCDPAKIAILPVAHGVPSDCITRKNDHDFQNPLRLVSVARFSEEKGLKHTLELLALLHCKGLKATLDLVGEGPLMASLRDECVRLKIADSVFFHGRLPFADALQIIAKSDLFVYTGVRSSTGAEDTFALAIHEAQALGIPCAIWKNGGVHEYISDGLNGIVVANGDLTALAEQILKLAADGRSYLQMKQHAVESAKRFSIEETTRKMCELYRLHLANL